MDDGGWAAVRLRTATLQIQTAFRRHRAQAKVSRGLQVQSLWLIPTCSCELTHVFGQKFAAALEARAGHTSPAQAQVERQAAEVHAKRAELQAYRRALDGLEQQAAAAAAAAAGGGSDSGGSGGGGGGGGLLPPPAEKEYTCEHGCGLRGGYAAVEQHELTCQANRARAEPESAGGRRQADEPRRAVDADAAAGGGEPEMAPRFGGDELVNSDSSSDDDAFHSPKSLSHSDDAAEPPVPEARPVPSEAAESHRRRSRRRRRRRRRRRHGSSSSSGSGSGSSGGGSNNSRSRSRSSSRSSTSSLGSTGSTGTTSSSATTNKTVPQTAVGTTAGGVWAWRAGWQSHRLCQHTAGQSSRRRDCHFADTPSPSLLKHLPKGEGETGAAK